MIELITIQTKLKAPKDKKNKFGDYNYRSVESICEAVKPLLAETQCTLTFTDDVLTIEGRLLIQSVATIANSKGESVSAKAYAELGQHKGMSPEQCFGTASSYARKYAVCALLLCDDSTDVDSLDNRDHNAQPVKAETPKKKKEVRVLDIDNEKAVNTIKDWILETRKHPSTYKNYWKNTYKSEIDFTPALEAELVKYYDMVTEG